MADVATWQATSRLTLDVREEIAQGGEPFVHIMEAAATVGAGESFVLVAPFVPVPLYGVLGAQGFIHETHSIASDEWVVRFSRS